MEETLQIVSYEQAKRLAALGFDWETHAVYMDEELDPDSSLNDWNNNGIEYADEVVSAPTTALALKWMRDTKELQHYGGTYYEKDKYVVWWRFRSEDLWDRTKICDSYEEAESALLDAVLTELEKGDAQ